MKEKAIIDYVKFKVVTDRVINDLYMYSSKESAPVHMPVGYGETVFKFASAMALPFINELQHRNGVLLIEILEYEGELARNAFIIKRIVSG